MAGSSHRGRRAVLSAGMGLGFAAPASAQPGFPDRPVTLVVPFPPGGSTDVMARLLAERMAPLLGQPVLVENRPGGATVVGAEAVARSAPDGHTVLVNSGTTLTINPLLMRSLPYGPESFAPVSLLATLPFAFLVQNRLPATIPEFVAFAKARPGKLNYGTNGPSSFNNIVAVLVSDALGIRMQDVTYRGDAAQLNDFVAGTLDVLVVGGSSAIGPHRNGQGRILAWTGDRRMPATPDIPIFAETAPEAVGQTWFGLAVPARTPAVPIGRLSAAAARALQEPALRDRLLGEGQFAVGSSPGEYGAFLGREMERWRPLLQRMDINVD